MEFSQHVLLLEQQLGAKADDQQCDRVSDGAANSVVSSSSSTSGAQRMEDCLSMSREQLIKEQQADVELCHLIEEAVDEEEATRYANCFYIKSGVLMRKWRPPDAPALDEW